MPLRNRLIFAFGIVLSGILPLQLQSQGGNAQQGAQANAGSKQDNKGAVQPPPCEIQKAEAAAGIIPFPTGGVVGPSGCKPTDPMKQWCTLEISHINWGIRTMYEQLSEDTAHGRRKDAQVDVQELDILNRYLNDLNRCVQDPPEPSYRRLAPAASDTPGAYVEAMTASMERYQGAQSQGDSDWMARHFTAERLYLKEYAHAMRASADALQKKAESLPEEDSTALANTQAVRDQFLEHWRQGQRFTPDQLNSFKQAGISVERVTAAIEAVIAQKEIPPVKSSRATLLETAAQDRQSADDAEKVANAPANSGEEGKPGQPFMQAYAVVNPHERQETVDLFIRPISVPADWKLSIVNAEEGQSGEATKPGNTPPKYPVHEIDPGKHYNITLPAKTEAQVASVVTPVGEVGARTTARWAVEGKIGNELIGGMVHEMNVPYIIADLQLPAVGSKEVEEEVPTPGRGWSRLIAAVAAAIVILGLLTFFFIFWRRRRKTGTPAAT